MLRLYLLFPIHISTILFLNCVCESGREQISFSWILEAQQKAWLPGKIGAWLACYYVNFHLLNQIKCPFPTVSVNGLNWRLMCCFFSPFVSLYQLNSFMKFWKPSSPKKSKEPSDEPRWTSRRTSRTTARRGISMFQPAARMLYHLALSEHSWANCRLPWVFWSLAYIHTHTHIIAYIHWVSRITEFHESFVSTARPSKIFLNTKCTWRTKMLS